MYQSRRTMPTQRMSVRTAGGASAHKSFRLTKPVKMKFIARGFGKSFIPEKFQKTIKAALPREAKTKDEAYFLRQARSDQTLTTSEQMKRFSKGFLQEAHEEGAKLRPGLNANSNVTEQAQKFLKSYQTEANKEKPWKERLENRQKLDSVRERLGILHAPPSGGGPGASAAVIEPTPLGHNWSGDKGGWDVGDAKAASAKTGDAAGPAAPSLSGGAAPFLGGNIAAVIGQRGTKTNDIPSSVQVRRQTADMLFLGTTIGEFDATRLTNLTGMTVESRRSPSPTDTQRTFAIVVVEDDGQTIDPNDIPRPRTAMIVFGTGLSEERQAAWKQVGATEIVAEAPNFDSVLAAIQRYVRAKPVGVTPPTVSETGTDSAEVHELPI